MYQGVVESYDIIYIVFMSDVLESQRQDGFCLRRMPHE
jgi:hypothetical protein